MSNRTTGRHRAPTRPKTPLTSLANVVSENATIVGRRSAVIAASGGLVVTMGLPAADANPAGEVEAAPTPPPTPVSTPDVVVDVTVPADASVSFARTALTTVNPPAPVVVPERVTAERASRTTARASLGTTVEAAPSEAAGAVLAIAARYVGTPYRYGGTTPDGFDCSGYTQYVFKQVGINLPRTSADQRHAGRTVPASEARPGDLVWKQGHVGIYAGGGMMYDAPSSGKSVSKREIWFANPVFIRVIG